MLMQVLSALLNLNLMKNELSSNKDKTIQMAYAQKRKGQSENSQY